MKKISKETELSIKALWAAIFMATVCLYIAIGLILPLLNIENFYHHISFALLIQGLIISMLSSATWVLSFGHNKALGFLPRYLLAVIVLAASVGISMLIPFINSTEGYLFWLASGAFTSLAFGTGIAVLSEKYLKKNGARSTLLWEITP